MRFKQIARFERKMNNELFFDTEDNFTPGAGKTLNQIFDMDQPTKPTDKTDESLRYTAVKSDATKAEKAVPPKRSWSTRLAKIVVAFKNGESVGRVGVAILRNVEFVYRIIVYKSKTNLLATLTIDNTDMECQIRRQNSYWQFFDDTGFYWSLLFERAADEADFINKLKDSDIRLQLDLEVNSASDIPLDEELRKKTVTGGKPIHEISAMCENKGNKCISNDDTTIEQNKTKSSSPDHIKLLTRLPKMGGKQLPILNDTYDSDTELNNETIDHCTSLTIIGKSTYPKSNEVRTQFVSQSSSVATASTATIFKPVEAQVMQLMLVENRTQNTELRINMDKLESKIEKVIDKIDMLQTNGEQDDEVLKLEEKILALKKENRRLKRECKNGNTKIDFGFDNVFNIYGTELANLGINLKPDDSECDMEGIVGELIDKIMNLQTQVNEKETQMRNVTAALKDQKERNQNDKQELTKLIEQLEQANHKIEILQTSLDKKKESEAEMKVRLNDLKSKHATNLNNLKLEMCETLKEIMNTLYHDLAQDIVGMEKLLPDKVLSLIGKTIRQDTLTAVAKIQK